MRRPFHAQAWLALALVATTASCMSNPPPAFPVKTGEEPNPIKVTTAPVSHVVHFDPGVASLSPDETLALRAFLHDKHARPGEMAKIIAGDTMLADARRNRVIAVLHQAGLDTVLAAPRAALPADAITVSLDRATAVLPHCPNWPQIGGNDPMNLTSSNLGCATSLDLAVMVADPEDLVVGRTPGPANAEPGVRAVETYLSGKKPAEDGDKGAPAAPASTAPASGGTTNAQ